MEMELIPLAMIAKENGQIKMKVSRDCNVAELRDWLTIWLISSISRESDKVSKKN